MTIGSLNTWVTLRDDVPDGTPKTFSPARVKVGLGGTFSDGRSSSGTADESNVIWTGISLRYHEQITFNTRMFLDDGRQLVVRAIGNYGNADRSGWMTVDCEEVLTP